MFLTGGTALIPGFKERLEKDLLEIRPFQSKFNVYSAGNYFGHLLLKIIITPPTSTEWICSASGFFFPPANPEFDAWNGARKWANNPENVSQYFITKGEYEEFGDGYFKEHISSNIFFSTPMTKLSTAQGPRNSTNPGMAAKRQVIPRNKQQRTVQLRNDSISS